MLWRNKAGEGSCTFFAGGFPLFRFFTSKTPAYLEMMGWRRVDDMEAKEAYMVGVGG